MHVAGSEVLVKVGAIVTTCPGREENLARCLLSLKEQSPDHLVVVLDGPLTREPDWATLGIMHSAQSVVLDRPHQPGDEQPRNVGVRAMPDDIEAVWFVDSDVIFRECVKDFMLERIELGADVVAAPYDWLEQGVFSFIDGVKNDPRWPMFEEEKWELPESQSVGELNVGLGCFSGNLMWRREAFERVGGFWNELHHGRCEDGELGLRAVAMGCPISLEPLARGQHLWHPVDVDRAVARNERDVPMLNARHPWVQGEGLLVADEDGKRFDQLCPVCGEQVNTILYWAHIAGHEAVPA